MEVKRRKANPLPIHDHYDTILSNAKGNLLIRGDTGCGKSTQVPIMLLSALDDGKMIIITQPRRVAALGLAKRVAQELSEEGLPEDTVGHHVRFSKKVTQNTKILFVTEGMFLKYLMTKHDMSKYQFVVIDEVHERSTDCDILLGQLKCMESDFSLIMMSATVSSETIEQFYPGIRKVECSVARHPIDIKYFPTKSNQLYTAIYNHIALSEYSKILVFSRW